MLHPFMPFVTEELWSKLGERPYELIVAQWPQPQTAVDEEAKAEINAVIQLISEIRSVRTELNVPPGAIVDIIAFFDSPKSKSQIIGNSKLVERMARVKFPDFPGSVSGAAAQVVIADATFVIPLEGVIDIAAEKARLAKALEVSTKEAKSLEGRLSNPSFVEKAKPEAVEKARADHAMHQAEAERLAAALARLG
ncbi:MAG TPA: class I tRNA ligase family protein, partial [Novosphingobium sp.]|nr:class I tRNA ligase family protein [Novosphingobium sp.]